MFLRNVCKRNGNLGSLEQLLRNYVIILLVFFKLIFTEMSAYQEFWDLWQHDLLSPLLYQKRDGRGVKKGKRENKGCKYRTVYIFLLIFY
jgi:hypothetical protein